MINKLINGEKVLVSSLKAGDVFYFVSESTKDHTGFYFKVNSAKNRGIHLESFKRIVFGDADSAVPCKAEIIINYE